MAGKKDTRKKINNFAGTMQPGDEIRIWWHKEVDGTYTKIRTVYSKSNLMKWDILEAELSEKEYFTRKLAGTL